jgi:hypothetical protein
MNLSKNATFLTRVIEVAQANLVFTWHLNKFNPEPSFLTPADFG